MAEAVGVGVLVAVGVGGADVAAGYATITRAVSFSYVEKAALNE